MAISPSEHAVMRIVWAHPECTAQHIIHILQPQQHWAPATIKTLIRRLVDKGFLSQQKRERQPFCYTATCTEYDVAAQRMTTAFNQVCTRQAGALLSDLLQTQPLSQSDIRHMMDILAQRAQGAPEQVTCCCKIGTCACQPLPVANHHKEKTHDSRKHCCD